MTQYTLTGSTSQMDCIKNACETQARLAMGQFCAVTDAFMMRLYDQDLELLCEKVRELERIVSNMPKNNKRSAYMELGWDIHQVLRHRLSWDRAIKDGLVKEGEPRDWKTMSMVCYDEPLHRGKEPLMKIKKEGEPEFSKDELDLFRQWFNSVQDTNPKYLKKKDYDLSVKLHKILNLRAANSVLRGAENANQG